MTHVRGRGRDARLLRYALADGWTVLAGRSDADNDRLSTRLARPGDLWFHVRGMPGSHVVLQGPEGAEPGRDTVRAAAAVAAWHSKAREGGVVAVSCTEARHVRKPRGAKPGTVEIRHETVLKVRPGLPEGTEDAEGTEGTEGTGVRGRGNPETLRDGPP